MAYTPDDFEIIGDAMEDLRDWEAFETDMKTHPWEDETENRGGVTPP